MGLDKGGTPMAIVLNSKPKKRPLSASNIKSVFICG